MWHWLADPLQYGFMQTALMAALILGVTSGLTSTFTVVRGMAFFADALAHAVLPGVALAFVWWGASGASLFWGALAAALLASWAVYGIARESRVREETAIGIVMAAALALGVAIISTQRTYAVDLSHVLFGDILGVGPEDLVRTAVLGAATLAVTVALWRPFSIVSFDPVLGATIGLRVGALQCGLLALIAVTTVLALQTVGVTMSLAILVIPGATARLLTSRLTPMALASVAIGIGASVVGLYASYYLSIPSGPAIVLAHTAIFAAARAATSLRPGGVRAAAGP
ncbi:metal ABC transporter permease [Carboxydochorda subterranea]|uniref:Metal ABC transporter permease n=1 Tax=Carboxydichorda subterranea TaxID=3109565 RepID=A0ABZ1BXQ9_9FIRM|nr:metal ABC transporter permease [Limnochorda sp. L945t]WRP17498.1 metal ABC transporter permease [Limnochorda sp. L945t]